MRVRREARGEIFTVESEENITTEWSGRSERNRLGKEAHLRDSSLPEGMTVRVKRI